MSGLILAGNFYLNRYVDGVLTGEHGPLNATKVAITLPEVETIKRKSYKRDDYGNTIDAVNLNSGSGSLSVDLDDADPDTLVYALLGVSSDVDAVSGSVDVGSPENVAAIFNRWSKLGHRVVSSVVIKDATDTTTYVAGTDYQLDAASGMVKTLSTGSIGDGDVLHASYSYAALNSRQILAAQSNEVRSFVRLDGVNLANQKKVELTIPEVALIPSGDINLISDEFMKYTLAGEIILRDGESAPFIYNEID